MTRASNPLNRRVREHLGFPIAPGAWPMVGHLPAMSADILGFLREHQRSLGTAFWFDIGSRYQLAVGGQEGFRLFTERSTDSSIIGEDIGHLLGGALLAVDGPEHRRQKKTLTKPFTPVGLRSAGVGKVSAGVVEQRVANWGREVKLLEETRDMTLDVIFRIIGIEGDVTEWRKQYGIFALGALKLPVAWPGTPEWRSRRARAWLDERLQQLVDAGRQQPPDTSLLTAMVHATDDDGEPLPDTQLVDNLRLLAFAGHETTASAMAWMGFYLAEHPKAWARLVDEVGGQPIPTSPQEASAFPYAEAVFREMLRLHPPVPINSRRIIAPIEVDGRTLPEGEVASILMATLSRDPDLYDDPDAFLPDRWLGRDHRPTPLETCQFGGGRHFCLGYHLAMLEGIQFGVALARRVGANAPVSPKGIPSGRSFPLIRPPYGMPFLLNR